MFEVISTILLEFFGELPLYILIFMICSFLGRGVRGL